MWTNVKPMRAVCALTLSALLGGACISPGPSEPENKAPSPNVVPPEPPRAAVPIAADALYNLNAVGANKCVQPMGKSNAPGMRLQIAACDGSRAQQFRLQSLPGNYYAIVNALSDLCADVSGTSTDNGASIVEYPCRSGLNQQWILADAPGGNLRLVARHSGKVADVQGASVADGSNLIQWPYSGDPNQRFKLTAVTAPPTPDSGAPAVVAVAGAEKGKTKGKAGAKTAKAESKSPAKPAK